MNYVGYYKVHVVVLYTDRLSHCPYNLLQRQTSVFVKPLVDTITHLYRHLRVNEVCRTDFNSRCPCHEKLNGKGYPRHLEGKDLNLIQRILTVADITSALHDSRSYKGEFNKEKILSIIKDMTDKGELDPQITKFVIEDFDRLVKEQQFFQGMLAIDFSKVIINYNNYIYEDVDLWVENLLNATTPYEEIEDIEELDDLEDLEEL